MFAVVRTGGKQYRVALGDRIVVERLDGAAGDQITLGEVLLAGEGSDLKSTSGLTVAAEIVAQAKGDKVTVFKKRRRHNYRRKQGHRQQHTILRIVGIGDQKEERKPAPKKAEQRPDPKAEPKASAAAASTAGDAGQPTPNPAPDDHKAAGGGKPPAKASPAAKTAEKPAAKAKPAKDSPKPAAAKAKAPSTENAAPAKGAAKKSPKAK